jgi:hypothetical protein
MLPVTGATAIEAVEADIQASRIILYSRVSDYISTSIRPTKACRVIHERMGLTIESKHCVQSSL